MPGLIEQLSWRRRGDEQIKRLKNAVKLDQSLTPYPFLWERFGPRRPQP